jgi:uncharacterized protein (DUF924 family)
MTESRATGPGTGSAEWALDVLHFWFDEVGPDQWYGAGHRLDPVIQGRFASLHEALATRALEPRANDGTESLATVIVLDQFSRHLFRGTPRAYACDALALSYARSALSAGLDASLSPAERMFLYLPLQHSESLADQDEAVRLFTSIGNDDWTSYAVAHQQVIKRFGRFPHRNAVLGRSSTPAELEAIAAGTGTSW